jgi:hypothetical protein
MSSLSRGVSRYLLIALMAVGMAGAALGLFLAGKAAILITLVALSALIALSLVRDLEYVSFLALAATMPIRLNMRLTEPAVYERAHSALGFLVGVTDCVVIVLMIAWARRVLFFDQPIRWLPKISIPMFLLFFWVAYAGLRAEADVASGSWMILRYLECCALMLYLVNNIRPIRDYLAHALTTSGMLLFESTLGLGQGMTGGFNFGMEVLGAPVKRSVEHSGSRITGTMPTPNAFAAMMAGFVLQPVGILFSRNRISKLAIGGLIVFTGFAILATKSRGVWLSSTLVFGYLIFSLLRTRYSSMRASFGVMWIALTLGIVALATPGVLDRLTEDDRGSAEARSYMNRIALNMIEAKPWFGFGWDNYTLHFEAYDDTVIKHSEAFPFIVHNGYAYTAAEYGVPALILLLWIWLVVMRRTLRMRPDAFTFPAIMAFLMPWGFVARIIQTPLYINNPLNSLDGWYTLGLCLVFRELADQDKARRAKGLPDPLTAKP